MSEFKGIPIVRSGGRQHKVSVGDVIEVDRLDGEVGSSVTLPALLLVDDGDAVDRVDLQDPVHLRQGQHDAALGGVGAARQASPLPTGDHRGAVRRLSFSSKGTLASASDDRTIRLWNLGVLEARPKALLEAAEKRYGLSSSDVQLLE